ncbi:MAG: hypothetical protein M3416_09260 [Acidobacteriota bacterium]|nr:hypothetical protein [Acidobacteriota bacterium]
MTQDCLLIADQPGEELFLASDGRPVWPVCTEEEREALSQLASLFGFSLKSVPRNPGRGVDACTEEVVGLGREVEFHAQLYAHLTGRRFRLFETFEELASGGSRPTVLLTLHQRLTPSVMDYMSTADAGMIPGIISADSLDALRLQVLLRSAAASLCGPVEIPRIDVQPLLPEGGFYEPGRVIVGGKASRDALIAALKQGAGVLTIDTHSDGVDAYLGPELTLCPMDRVHPKASTEKAPFCHPTGVCYRHKIPVTDARQANLLFSPDSISARVLILNSCRGVLLPGGLIDPLWGFAWRLCQNPAIGAVVMTCEMLLHQAPVSNPLSRDIASGMPVGRALAQFLGARESRSLGHRMCLFGDPRVRATSRARRGQSSLREKRPPRIKRERVSGSDRSDLGLLRGCLTYGRRSESKTRARFAAAALRAVTKYEYAAWTGGQLEGAATAPGPKMRQAVLRYLLSRGELFEDWIKFGAFYRAIRGRRGCPNCGEPVKSYMASFRIPNVPDRRLDTCTYCEIIQDAPAGVDFSLTAVDGTALQISGKLPTENWTAGIITTSWHVDRMWEWPAGPSGSPAVVYEPPGGLPPRQVYIAVFMLWEANVVSLRLRAQGAGELERFLNTPCPLLDVIKKS